MAKGIKMSGVDFMAASILVILLSSFCKTGAFSVPFVVNRIQAPSSFHQRQQYRVTRLNVAQEDYTQSAQSPSNDENDSISDEQILNDTKKSELVALCEQFSLSGEGSKKELLHRLRQYAQEQEEKERQRLEQRRERVEAGGDEREKFEILDDGEVDSEEDDDIFFYYHAQVPEEKNDKEKKNQSTSKAVNSQGVITAPPPPPIEPDENGERVVTVYSTTDQNDLTGIAASQPGGAGADPMTSTVGQPEDASWDVNNPQKRDTTDSADIVAAQEEVSELVHNLLAMTGAPSFQQDGDELEALGINRRKPAAYTPSDGFVGFDPAKVPTDVLTKCSKSLRTKRGQVLKEVIRKYELRAVGYDGAFGDNKEKGGGHYLEVSKVRSFLEGYRRAEVRRLARDTATMLLDKLVSEGIEGLDVVLASMTRNDDDTSDEAGELNDSLLDYLNDAIRQQEKKVEQVVDSIKKREELENSVADEEPDDRLEKLWTVDDEDGQVVETFNPNDKSNQKILREEFEKSRLDTVPGPVIPTSAAEKLLLLLRLLRERVKTEAVFSHDEKSRNLRILAYCLRLTRDDQRKELIIKEFGASLDRLDSFAEMVSSSIEYGESASNQLRPSQRDSLDVGLLKRILNIVNETREKQGWKASGAQNPKLRP